MAGNGRWGNTGDDGPATEATLAGPAGIAVVADPAGKLTLFIADYYNGRVRAVGPDGIIREVNEDREAFDAPTRVAYAPSGGWLYVTDSLKDRLVVLNIAKMAPTLRRHRRRGGERARRARRGPPHQHPSHRLHRQSRRPGPPHRPCPAAPHRHLPGPACRVR